MLSLLTPEVLRDWDNALFEAQTSKYDATSDSIALAPDTVLALDHEVDRLTAARTERQAKIGVIITILTLCVGIPLGAMVCSLWHEDEHREHAHPTTIYQPGTTGSDRTH